MPELPSAPDGVLWVRVPEDEQLFVVPKLWKEIYIDGREGAPSVMNIGGSPYEKSNTLMLILYKSVNSSHLK